MKFSTLILLLTWCTTQSFAMDVDAQGYKIQREPIAPSLSLVCASATASHTELQSLSNLTTQRVDKKRIVPLYSDRLLNLVPALAQFPTVIWQNIIMPYALSRTIQESISLDLSKFPTVLEKSNHTIPGVPNHSRTQYIFYDQDTSAIFDASTAKISHPIPHENLSPYSVNWSPNDSFLGIFLRSGDVHILDIISGQTTSLPTATAYRTKEIAWRHDSNQIATFTYLGDVAIWDITNLEKPIAKLGIAGNQRFRDTLLWTPHNQLIIAYLKSIDLWNPVTKQLVRSLEDSSDYHFNVYSLSPSGKYLAAHSWKPDSKVDKFSVWNIETGKLEHRLPDIFGGHLITLLSWSCDEIYLTIQQDKRPVHFLDMRTGTIRSIESARECEYWTPPPISWDKDKKVTLYSTEDRITYDFTELHAFDDGLLSPKQTIFLSILTKNKNSNPSSVTLESIAQDLEQEHITKKDLYDVLISFSPKIRLAIIAHYKITDAIGASPSSAVLSGDKSPEQKPDAP